MTITIEFPNAVIEYHVPLPKIGVIADNPSHPHKQNSLNTPRTVYKVHTEYALSMTWTRAFIRPSIRLSRPKLVSVQQAKRTMHVHSIPMCELLLDITSYSNGVY